MRTTKFHAWLLLAATCVLLHSSPAYSQTESHNFITYDTAISIPTGPWSAPDKWNVRISRPVNMFITGDPDTASRPALIMMPGQGELGVNDTSKLVVYGPHYWLKNGWDGSVQLGNGKHYPILITVCYLNNVWPTAPSYYNLLILLFNTYHIKRNSVHVTGLSQGSFTNGALIKYEATAGAETGMKLITSAALFEGTPDPLPAPYSTWDRDTVAYKVWAAKYHGRYFSLEGNGSDNFRDSWHYAVAMNDTVPGSAYFSYENLGGGAHCCWNSMYDPSATNWTSVGTLGPANAPSQVGKNTMGDYHGPCNVFQWMLRQGDTSIVNSSSAQTVSPTITAGAAQAVTMPVTTATLTGGDSTNGGAAITSTAWSQISGPNTAGIVTPSTLSTQAMNLVAGTYIFQLTATNATGQSASGKDTVIVYPASIAGYTPIPGIVQAENYTSVFDARTQATTDAGGGLNVGWINKGSWMNYQVNAATAGSYTASFRVATPNAASTLQLKNAAGTVLATLNLPITGAWQTWQTVTATVTLPAGPQTLQILSTSTAMWNINWIDFETGATQTQEANAMDISATALNNLPGTTTDLSLYPNPTQDNFTLNLNSSHMGKMIVQVIDPAGVIKKTYSLSRDGQYSSTSFNVADLAPGLYFVRVQIAGWSTIQKLLKL